VVYDDLINFFLNNMVKDGWKKVSAVRSKKSILIFEKANKACTIEVVDGYKAKATVFAFEYGRLLLQPLHYPEPPWHGQGPGGLHQLLQEWRQLLREGHQQLSTAHLQFPCFLGKRVHLGVTGSVAAYKSIELLRLLRQCQVAVSVTLTESALRFVGPESFRALGADTVTTSMFGPGAGEDPFVHLTPGQTASAMVIAPATANILAKLAHGLADDLLSTQALAFGGPLLLAPAMNPAMWSAPATQANWRTLLQRGAVGIGPAVGDVACGDTGKGKLSPGHIWRGAARLPRTTWTGRLCSTSAPPANWMRALPPSGGLMGACLAVAWMRGLTCAWWLAPRFDFPPGIEVTCHFRPADARRL
jgi:hypothetical protein